MIQSQFSARTALAVIVSALVFAALPGEASAQWNAAQDEANRQRAMESMRQSAVDADRRANEQARERQRSVASQSGSSTSPTAGSTSSSASYAPSGSSGGGYEGPQSVVATKIIRVFIKETPAEAEERLIQEAQAGDSYSQYLLGFVNYTGFLGKRDDAAARLWFSKSADQGNTDAAGYAGYMIYNGRSGPEDKVLGRQYLRTAADTGMPWALARLGIIDMLEASDADDGRSVRPSVAMLEQASLKGDAFAQSALGTTVYFYGTNDVPKDIGKAVQYLKLAAAQNEPMAMDLLGLLYMTGNGVARNDKEGWRLMRAAADAGIASSQYYVGMSTLQGSNGFTQNDSKGVTLLKAAVAQSHPAAMGTYSSMLSMGEFVAQDKAAAVKYAKLAAEAGDSGGMISLAYLYYDGEGIGKDLSQAFRWAKAAADSEDPTGVRLLGQFYADGAGVPVDKKMATQLYMEAAALGDAEAATLLAEPEFAAIKASLVKQGLVEN